MLEPVTAPADQPRFDSISGLRLNALVSTAAQSMPSCREARQERLHALLDIVVVSLRDSLA
jgi:hypothetical protein